MCFEEALRSSYTGKRNCNDNNGLSEPATPFLNLKFLSWTERKGSRFVLSAMVGAGDSLGEERVP